MQVILTPYPDDADTSVLGGRAFAAVQQRKADGQSAVSGGSSAVRSTSSSAASNLSKSTSILDAGPVTRGPSRIRRQRHALLDQELRKVECERERDVDERVVIEAKIVKVESRTTTSKQGDLHISGRVVSSEVGSISSKTNEKSTSPHRQVAPGDDVSTGSNRSKRNRSPDAYGLRRVHNEELVVKPADGSNEWWFSSMVTGIGKLVLPSDSRPPSSDSGSRGSRRAGSPRAGSPRAGSPMGWSRGRPPSRTGSGDSIFSRRNHSPERSVLSRLDDCAISPNDAADYHDPGYDSLAKPIATRQKERRKETWWKTVLAVCLWDNEMKRIVKLSAPYSLSGLLQGIMETILVALVAHFLGSEAVAAYTLVEVVLGVTSEFFGGVLAAEATLCSHAIGAGNYKLAGQYVQLSALIYTICIIPNIVFWLFFLDDAIRWFGFNEATVELGYRFGVIVLFHEWLEGMGYAYHGLLDVMGREVWSTIISFFEDLSDVVVSLLVLLYREDTTLQDLALIHLAVGIVFFVFNCWYTVYRGWMNPYLEGMVGSFAVSVSSRRFVDNKRYAAHETTSELLCPLQRCRYFFPTCLRFSFTIRRGKKHRDKQLGEAIASLTDT